MYRKAVAIEDSAEQYQTSRLARRFHMIGDAADKFDDLTRSFVRLSIYQPTPSIG
jgi:hypothetical protein